MPAPIYQSDLVDITLAESTTGFVAYGGGGAGLGAGADFAMQGTNCVDKQITATEKGIMFNNGAPLLLVGGEHIFVWNFTATPGVTDTLANRGVAIALGDDASNFCKYHVDGKDTFGAGGRVGKCYPIDPSVFTSNISKAPYRTIVGTPTGVIQYLGSGLSTTASVRSANMGLDAIRVGSGVFITEGLISDPATFLALAIINDEILNRWGIYSSLNELQGRVTIGESAAGLRTACYFKDSNRNIIIPDTPHSASNFTGMTVVHAGTVFDVTNVNIESKGINNRGLFFVDATDNPTVNITGGTWDGFGEITLQSNTTIDGLTLRDTLEVLSNGSDLSNMVLDKVNGNYLFSLKTGNISYVGEATPILTEDTSPQDVVFNNDGTKFFTMGGSTDTVYEYTLSIAYDVTSTVTYTGNSFLVGGQENQPRCLTFNNDGTKFFVAGITNNRVYEYTVSIGFDLSSTVAYSGNSFSTVSEGSQVEGLTFNTDGTKFFIVLGLEDIVVEYTVSVGFDLSSTVAYSGNSFSVVTETTSPRGVVFNNNGTKFFVVGGGSVFEYPCSIGFDLSSTVAYSGNSFLVNTHESGATGLAFDQEGSRMYITGTTSDKVHSHPVGKADQFAIEVSDLSEITNSEFINEDNHAVRLTSIGSGSMNWSNIASGYAAVDGSTGLETVFVDVAAGTLEINVVAGATIPSIRTSGAVVTVISGAVDLTITVQDSVTLELLQNVQTSIHLKDDPFTPLMNEDTTVLGVATESYSGPLPVDVVWKCRKSEITDDPRYTGKSGITKIDSSGLSVTVLLKVNPILTPGA